MKKLKISGKDLRRTGIEDESVIMHIKRYVEKHYKKSSKDEIIDLIEAIKDQSEKHKGHPLYSIIHKKKKKSENKQDAKTFELTEKKIPYNIFGKEIIDPGAIKQMDIAMQLPVALKGALMPDAHQGYGLPIGGVLATDNAVIPYGVGMDIGCRMCLSVYPFDNTYIKQNRKQLLHIIQDSAHFGRKAPSYSHNDKILEDKAFKEISFLKSLKSKAAEQLGTSGSGNHFADIGIIEVKKEIEEKGLKPGDYLAILTHSGSRGMGAEIARHYTRLAMDKCQLPKKAKHLAWFDMNSEEGMEYWIAMTLAGDYSAANHKIIHQKISNALKVQPVAIIENHHNYAWKEDVDGHTNAIVHRKGATPAHKGILGVIPGSMASPAFVVRGKGNPSSINSASHGAGRRISRNEAKRTVHRKSMYKALHDAGIELIGGGTDEAPNVYKDIHKVMDQQHELVDVYALFYPSIVRMD